MRFGFFDEPVTETELTEADITAEERQFNIRFPDVLREFYLTHNGCYVREMQFLIDGAFYDVEEMLPLTGTRMTMSHVREQFSENPEIPGSFYPIAINSSEGTYFWDSLTGEIWFVAENSSLSPEYVFGSIQEMFEAMEQALTKDGYTRVKREEGVRYLPTGSVVILRNGSRKVMIVGRGLMAEVDGQTYYFDYSAVSYPEGVDGKEFIYFDHSWIRQVVFRGYHDDEDVIVNLRLNEYLNNHPDLPRYPAEKAEG